ncbi:LytR/AlgR family response regulator transcription factor [Agaribacter marinus]|uniref:DNA-binding response regulator n=1 Tax=Agaribacter marinus TaxID=1431249 RepID=A0AA37WJ47_9ALTE|nr:LytTR family DNA-binding domain-containing protein [Agaribacter marinus]GLR72661.1 DNA-binding response regulator [Agaribacter marinus]
MKIMVVEDEELIAERIVRMCKHTLNSRLLSIVTRFSLEEADIYLESYTIDVLLLDLNLNGKDGFELLERAVASSFHTIIISANTDQAVRAFEYGVLDFIGKPLSHARLEKAFNKYDGLIHEGGGKARYVSVKKNGGLILLNVNDINYIKGCGVYTDIHMQDGRNALHDKSLNRLEAILPQYFFRVHKSYIVNLQRVKEIKNCGDNKHELILLNGESLPLSRAKYKSIKHNML